VAGNNQERNRQAQGGKSRETGNINRKHSTGNTQILTVAPPPLKDSFQTSQSVQHGWVEGSRRRGQGYGGQSPGGGPEDDHPAEGRAPGGGPEDRNGELGDQDQVMRPGLDGTGHEKQGLDGTRDWTGTGDGTPGTGPNLD